MKKNEETQNRIQLNARILTTDREKISIVKKIFTKSTRLANTDYTALYKYLPLPSSLFEWEGRINKIVREM